MIYALSTGIFRVSSLFIGMFSIYLGYKLFMNGIWGDAGSFKVNSEDLNLVMKNAAPGTFFALFGSGIIIASLAIGVNVSYTKGNDRVKSTIIANETLSIDSVRLENKAPQILQMPNQ